MTNIMATQSVFQGALWDRNGLSEYRITPLYDQHQNTLKQGGWTTGRTRPAGQPHVHGYCCDRKSRAVSAQSFALWQQTTVEFTRRDHSIIACSRHIYECYSSRTSRSWWMEHSAQRQRRGCNSTYFESVL